MKTTKQTLLTIIICLAILAGVNLVYGGTWSSPACDPSAPGGPQACNTPEPINVSISEQTKTGKLNLGNLTALNILTSSFQMTNGTGAGKVLTSDASGVASWQTPSAGGYVSGGWYGWCHDWILPSESNRRCRTSTILPKPPATCAGVAPFYYGTCQCPSGFTKLIYMLGVTANSYIYTCYKN